MDGENGDMILWQHKKRGTIYRVLHGAQLQLDGEHDMSPVVVYQDVDSGSIWVRLRSEFYDGRFEALARVLTPPPASEDAPHAG